MSEVQGAYVVSAKFASSTCKSCISFYPLNSEKKVENNLLKVFRLSKKELAQAKDNTE